MWLMIVGACAVDPTYPPLQPLFHQLDSRLPRGDYRIPSLVSTLNGTLLAFVAGREHRTDYTPNIIYLRRSQDDGATWTEAVPVLEDPTNCTEFDVTPVVDASDGRIHLIHHRRPWCGHHMGCPMCLLWDAVSSDDGATWGAAAPLTTVGPANTTWGNGLASGISLTRGPHAGRLLVALRHDCGCGDKRVRVGRSTSPWHVSCLPQLPCQLTNILGPIHYVDRRPHSWCTPTTTARLGRHALPIH